MNMNIFYNCESIFIEYNDIIKAPMFTLLSVAKNNERLKEIMDFDKIHKLSTKGLLEWYVTRKHYNPFEDLIKQEVPYDKANIDGLLYSQLSCSSKFIEYSEPLLFVQTLRVLISREIVKKIFIYSPIKLPGLEDDLKLYLDKDINFLYGELEECLKLVPNDSTYVLSDIEKVNIIDKCNKLNMSAVIIPYSYRYNYKLNSKINFKVDFDKLFEKSVFKYGFFRAI